MCGRYKIVVYQKPQHDNKNASAHFVVNSKLRGETQMVLIYYLIQRKDFQK